MMKAQAQQSEKTASPHRSFLAPQRRFVPDALRPRGDPIQAAPRAFTDPQLGHDFSQVRVYPNAQAYEYALAINAPPSALNSDDEQETQRVDNLNRRSNVNRASQESLSMVEHHRYPFAATIPRVAKSRFSHGKGKYALSEKPAP